MQKRLAADILKCGENRVWIDPTGAEEVSEAVTRSDIRSMINSKWIRKKAVKGISSGRKKKRKAQKKKGKRKGQGKRKGKKGARTPKKELWMKRIRALRAQLRMLKDAGKIDASTYRRYYRHSKGGEFRSKAHLLLHMKTDGVLISEEATQQRSDTRTVKKIKRRRVVRRNLIMAKRRTSRVPFRRRREGRTNYKKRLAFLKSGKPRAVVRITQSKIIIQMIEYHSEGDRVISSVVSHSLKKYGWKHTLNSIPASYLTGLLAGTRARKQGINKAVLDIGLRVPVKGSRVFAALRGLLDAQMDVPHGEGIFPSEDVMNGKFASAELGADVEELREKIIKSG